MHKLIQALPERSHLLIVGDVDQLPSVGPGSALADILRSEVVPAGRLREIFRQAASSRIVINAHRIRGARSGQSHPKQVGTPAIGEWSSPPRQWLHSDALLHVPSEHTANNGVFSL